MKQRVFIGIKADSKLVERVASFRAKYKQKLPVRWIEDRNLHVTLIPPWYEDNIAEVVKVLQKNKIGIAPFTLGFERVLFGPTRVNPRLIWAEGETPEELLQLKKVLEKTLNRKSESRDYKLHLTLARFNQNDFKNFPVKILDEKVDWKFRVDRFTLFESKLLKSGAEYKVLHELKIAS